MFSAGNTTKYDFREKTEKAGLKLRPVSIDTLQLNITRLCNQACHHCHVDASPARKEMMSREIIEQCLRVAEKYPQIKNIDITGGAPELHPDFDYLVKTLKNMNRHIMVRHNLTVTLDGNPQTGENKGYLPELFADNGVEVISSLPYFQEFFTDKQRGRGVFHKSLESLKLLNKAGYGSNPGMVLNLVYNPAGVFMPPEQKALEIMYKKELYEKHGIVFNNLYTITNMPVNRFKKQLEHLGTYDEYMDRLVKSFNPASAAGIMCRSMLSVGYEGRLYDCDFNQMLGLEAEKNPAISDFDMKELLEREISFGPHCFGCTAGAGSSCTGATS